MTNFWALINEFVNGFDAGIKQRSGNSEPVCIKEFTQCKDDGSEFAHNLVLIPGRLPLVDLLIQNR